MTIYLKYPILLAFLSCFFCSLSEATFSQKKQDDLQEHPALAPKNITTQVIHSFALMPWLKQQEMMQSLLKYRPLGGLFDQSNPFELSCRLGWLNEVATCLKNNLYKESWGKGLALAYEIGWRRVVKYCIVQGVPLDYTLALSENQNHRRFSFRKNTLDMACEKGDKEIVLLFLLNSTYEAHWPQAFFIACFEGKVKVVQCFIERGVPLISYTRDIFRRTRKARDTYEKNGLDIAYKKNHIEVVKLFLTNPAYRAYWPRVLFMACLEGKIEMARPLIDQSVPLTFISRSAANRKAYSHLGKKRSNYSEQKKTLVFHLPKENAFDIACQKKYTEIVQFFLEHEDYDRFFTQAFCYACYSGYVDIVECFLERKVLLPNKMDEKNPLVVAISFNSIDVIPIFLENPFYSDIVLNHGEELLYIATFYSNHKVAKWFIMQNVDLGFKNLLEENAFLLAVRLGDKGLVRTFLDQKTYEAHILPFLDAAIELTIRTNDSDLFRILSDKKREHNLKCFDDRRPTLYGPPSKKNRTPMNVYKERLSSFDLFLFKKIKEKGYQQIKRFICLLIAHTARVAIEESLPLDIQGVIHLFLTKKITWSTILVKVGAYPDDLI